MAATDDTHTGHSAAAAAAEDQAAPGRLEIVRSLVNTHDAEDGIEELATPEAMQAWLARHDLAPVSRAGAADVRRLTELREAIRQLLLANNGLPAEERALARLRREAGRVDLRVAFGAPGESELVPAGNGMDAVAAELLGILHAAMADGTWTRLKACRSDTCEWAFYDRSRNRSATWCSMAVCGNREKARAYRRRHASP
jgi:predicted RNA-binding Zn ribbon-like protein